MVASFLGKKGGEDLTVAHGGVQRHCAVKLLQGVFFSFFRNIQAKQGRVVHDLLP